MNETAKKLRALLAKKGLSQLRAAKVIKVDPRTMRRYCLGESRIPESVFLALRSLS